MYSETINTGKLYLLVEENGDIFAEIRLPNTYTPEGRDEWLGAMAQATGTKWTEA